MTKKNTKIDPKNYTEMEEDSVLLYSYLKKKGKHQREQDQKTRKK